MPLPTPHVAELAADLSTEAADQPSSQHASLSADLMATLVQPSDCEAAWRRYEQGDVQIDSFLRQGLIAIVQGSEQRYRVTLWPPEGQQRRWRGHCRCQAEMPTATQEVPACRHALAAAFAIDALQNQLPEPWASRQRALGVLPGWEQAPGQVSRPQDKARDKQLRRLHSALQPMDSAQMRLLMLTAARASEEVARVLLEHCSQFDLDPDVQRAAIEAMLKRSGTLKGPDAQRYADKLLRACDQIEQRWLAEAHHVRLGDRVGNRVGIRLGIDLVEEALKRGNSALATASDGSGVLSEAVAHTQTLWCRFLRALSACEPDAWGPQQVARRFYDQVMSQPVHSDGFNLSVLTEQQAPPLLSALGSVAHERYERLRNKHGASDPRCASLRIWAQRVAELQHDVDAWLGLENTVGVDRRDLDGMLDRLIQVGRIREAIQLAEQTLRRERIKTPDALRARLAQLYWDDGLEDDALQLLWDNFAAGGDVPAWRALQKLLQGCAASVQTHWRERAHARLIELDQQRAKPEQAQQRPLTVAWLLERGELAAARTAAAAGGLSLALRVRLAAAELASPEPDAVRAGIERLREACRDALSAHYVSPGVYADVLQWLQQAAAQLKPTTMTQQASWRSLLEEVRRWPKMPRYAQLALDGMIQSALTPSSAPTILPTSPTNDPQHDAVSNVVGAAVPDQL